MSTLTYSFMEYVARFWIPWGSLNAYLGHTFTWVDDENVFFYFQKGTGTDLPTSEG